MMQHRIGRDKTLDRQCPVSARAEFLHVASRAGSAATRHLHWLASAQNARRHRSRRSLCYSFDLYSLGAQLRLCRVWKYPLDRGPFLRTQTGCPCDCRRSTVIRIGSKALKNAVMWSLALAAFVAIYFFSRPHFLNHISAGFLGLVGSRILPQYFAAKSRTR